MLLPACSAVRSSTENNHTRLSNNIQRDSIYLRDETNIQISNSADSVWARQRFKAVAEMVHQRSMDLSKITQDQMNFIAQRNNPRGIKTMRAYYWHICGQEYDAQHPRN